MGTVDFGQQDAILTISFVTARVEDAVRRVVVDDILAETVHDEILWNRAENVFNWFSIKDDAALADNGKIGRQICIAALHVLDISFR